MFHTLDVETGGWDCCRCCVQLHVLGSCACAKVSNGVCGMPAEHDKIEHRVCVQTVLEFSAKGGGVQWSLLVQNLVLSSDGKSSSRGHPRSPPRCAPVGSTAQLQRSPPGSEVRARHGLKHLSRQQSNTLCWQYLDHQLPGCPLVPKLQAFLVRSSAADSFTLISSVLGFSALSAFSVSAVSTNGSTAGSNALATSVVAGSSVLAGS